MPKYTIKWVESVEYITVVDGPNADDALQAFYDGEILMAIEPTGWAEMEPDSVQVFEENSDTPIDLTA
jgi:hypothetical protein